MRTFASLILTCTSLVLVTGCGNDDIQVDGTYISTAVWDLSAPFGRNGIGGAFADLLIEEAVGVAVPGLIEDEAIELTSALIRSPIRNLVEARLHEDLKADGPVLLGLRDTLRAVQVETTIKLDDDIEGTEQVTKLTFSTSADPYVLSAADLPPGVSVAADLKGDREARDRIELEPYDLQLRYGDLIFILVGEILNKDVSALRAGANAAVPCDMVVQEITDGDGGFEFSVASKSFTISAGALQTACDVVKSELAQYALGLIRLDSGVQLGGSITLLDSDQDLQADTLSSDQEYQGRITLLPGPFEPQFAVNFVAQRR